MYVEQDNKVHFDKSDLIDPVIPSPFWKKPSITMTNPEVQIIAENCDNEKNAQAGESDRLEHQPIFDTYTGIDKNINDVIMMLLENTNKGISIVPNCTPIHKIKSFDDAKRRIYMSATLPDDSPFATVMGVDFKEDMRVITPEKANDIGERLIVVPKLINKELTEMEMRNALIEKAKECVLTDIDSMSNAPYLDTVCNTVIQSLHDNGYLIDCQIYILHDDFDNSMDVIDEYGNVQRRLSKKQIEILTECDENEFAKKSVDELSIKRQIEKKRYEINPFINNQYLKTPEYIKREIEIQENAISKKQLKELIDAGASERELDALIKKDLSLIAEIYSSPDDEYIVFSEFPLGEKRVDFAIFSSRSTMDVTFIEIKGADFNLKKRGHYDNLNAKIEEANSQIRNHRKYIYNNYESFRKELHGVRKRAESGENIYNAFLAPKRKLQVDPNKNVNIRFVIVAGRTPENDIEESDLRYQFGRDDRDVELFSWDSWIRRLSRD